MIKFALPYRLLAFPFVYGGFEFSLIVASCFCTLLLFLDSATCLPSLLVFFPFSFSSCIKPPFPLRFHSFVHRLWGEQGARLPVQVGSNWGRNGTVKVWLLAGWSGVEWSGSVDSVHV